MWVGGSRVGRCGWEVTGWEGWACITHIHLPSTDGYEDC